MGVDLHGQDVNKAAGKAIKDAISKSCLCGLEEILNVQDMKNDVYANITIAVSDPDKIDKERVAEYLPIGKKSVKVVQGGLRTSGLYYPKFGDRDDSIEIAIACIEVAVE